MAVSGVGHSSRSSIEAQRVAEERRKRAEEARRKAAEEAKRKAEAEARRRAEEAQRQRENAEAKMKAQNQQNSSLAAIDRKYAEQKQLNRDVTVDSFMKDGKATGEISDHEKVRGTLTEASKAAEALKKGQGPINLSQAQDTLFKLEQEGAGESETAESLRESLRVHGFVDDLYATSGPAKSSSVGGEQVDKDQVVAGANANNNPSVGEDVSLTDELANGFTGNNRKLFSQTRSVTTKLNGVAKEAEQSRIANLGKNNLTLNAVGNVEFSKVADSADDVSEAILGISPSTYAATTDSHLVFSAGTPDGYSYGANGSSSVPFVGDLPEESGGFKANFGIFGSAASNTLTLATSVADGINLGRDVNNYINGEAGKAAISDVSNIVRGENVGESALDLAFGDGKLVSSLKDSLFVSSDLLGVLKSSAEVATKGGAEAGSLATSELGFGGVFAQKFAANPRQLTSLSSDASSCADIIGGVVGVLNYATGLYEIVDGINNFTVSDTEETKKASNHEVGDGLFDVSIGMLSAYGAIDKTPNGKLGLVASGTLTVGKMLFDNWDAYESRAENFGASVYDLHRKEIGFALGTAAKTGKFVQEHSDDIKNAALHPVDTAINAIVREHGDEIIDFSNKLIDTVEGVKNGVSDFF